MQLPILMVTRRLPEAIEARLQTSYAPRWRNRDGCDWKTLTQAAVGVLCTPADRVDAAAIGAMADSVRVIGTFSVGYEHIDIAAAAARGITVVNTPGVLSDATAEFTLLLLLAAARRAGEGERRLRAGKWAGWETGGLLGTQVSGKRLAILGMGRIGQTLARMAQGLTMEVHYRNRHRLPPDEEHGAIWHEADESFLGSAAFLALCAPGGAQTRHWLNAARLRLLPQGAVVVNTSRGSLVDDAALISALQRGHVAAAGLDVFLDEPNVPAEYLALQNVVLTPHIASATRETRDAMGHLVLDGIDAVLAGGRPVNVVI